MHESVVEAQELHMQFAGRPALQDVSFEVHQDETLAIIGPNGSGKTTAVECVEGLRRPQLGKVRVFGKDPWIKRKEIYDHLGVQLQETQYPRAIRVGEQCRLFASFYDNPADWPVLLRQLDLWEKRRSLISSLSGGEKQKLSILLALMGRPRLLILDELTTGLDPQTRRSLHICLRSIREQGTALILVSHYLDDVEALADRILFLQSGHARFLGTQNEFRRYAAQCVPGDAESDTASLEDLYLLLVPQAAELSAEAIQ